MRRYERETVEESGREAKRIRGLRGRGKREIEMEKERGEQNKERKVMEEKREGERGE